VPTLEQNLHPVLGARPNRVVLDFSGLVMLGSAGIGALLKLRRQIEDSGGRLTLAALPESVRKVLVFSGLNRLFLTAADTQSALGN
jgi:anti-anti-sigma factor